jgi:hypothetical protein
MKPKLALILLAVSGLFLSGCAYIDWQREPHPYREKVPGQQTTTTTTLRTTKFERRRLPAEENDADEITRYEGLM